MVKTLRRTGTTTSNSWSGSRPNGLRPERSSPGRKDGSNLGRGLSGTGASSAIRVTRGCGPHQRADQAARGVPAVRSCGGLRVRERVLRDRGREGTLLPAHAVRRADAARAPGRARRGHSRGRLGPTPDGGQGGEPSFLGFAQAVRGAHGPAGPLNTSFNLKGQPIVKDPAVALETFVF